MDRSSPDARADRATGRSRWLPRSTWLLFVGLLPALHLLGSCSRDSSDDAAPATESTDAPAATEPESTEQPGSTEQPVTSDDADEVTTTAGPTTTAANDAVEFTPPAGNPESLDEWNQLGLRDGRLVPLDGVTPYTLSSALFSDHAHKLRTVWIPAGAPAAIYDGETTFDFPVGTVITKTFYYPTPDDSTGAADEAAPGVMKTPEDPTALAEGLAVDEVRLIETRVLTRRDDGWHAFPYVWDDEESEATLQRSGDLRPLTLVDAGAGTETPFTYVVPDVNQCANCHAVDHSSGEIEPIGPKARHLNIDVDLGTGDSSQLAAWIDRGILAESPPPSDAPRAADWTDPAEPIDDRARAYLDINCAHCHNPTGAADTSGLFLEASTEVGLSLGICKTPIAAGRGTGGRQYDIVPGDPLASIFEYRMQSTDPAEMMPELGRSLAHDEGVDLITEWIAQLPGGC